MGKSSKPVKVAITGDVKGFQKAIGEAESRLSKFSQKAQDMGKTLTLGVTLPVAALGTKVFLMAGEVEDSMALVDSVFGKNADSMKEWTETTGSLLGISQGDAAEWSSQFGIALQNVSGMTQEESAAMSQTLVGLQADLASAFGVDNDVAGEAIRAALTGETEQLKKFGVVINDTILKERALEMGIWDGTGALDAQQKSLATQAELMDQTSMHQGDFIKNADGTTNSLKIMKAEIENAGVAIGTVLLPVVTPLVQKVADLAQGFATLNPEIQTAIVIAAGIAASLGPLLYVVGSIGKAMVFLNTVAGPGMIALLGKLGAVVMAHPIIAAIVAITTGLVLLYKHSDRFRAIVDKVVDVLQQLAPIVMTIAKIYIAEAIRRVREFAERAIPVLIEKGKQLLATMQAAWGAILGVVRTFLDWANQHLVPFFRDLGDLLAAVWRRIVDVTKIALAILVPYITTAFDIIWNVVKVAVDFIIGLIKTLWNVLKPIWTNLWDFFRESIDNAWEIIEGIIEGALDIIRGIFQVFTGILTLDWGKAWDGIQDIVSGAWDIIVTTFKNIFPILWSLVKNGLQMLGGIFVAAWGGIKSGVTGFVATVIDAIKALPGKMLNAASGILGVAKGIGEGIISSITGAISGATSWVTNLGKRVVNSIIGFLNDSMIDKINGLTDKVKVFGQNVIPKIPNIPKIRAMGGGTFEGGAVRVGERGPETLLLPGGSRIVPNHAGGGSTGGVTVNLYGANVSARDVADEVAWQIRHSGK